MSLYLFAVLWPLFIGYLYRTHPFSFNGKHLSRNFHIILAMLPMFLMIALRNAALGADTGVYANNFYYVAKTPLDIVINNSRMEDGYLMFVKFISTYITKNANVFQVIYTAIYALSVFIFMQDLEDNWSEFLFFFGTLGLFTFMFTGVRQCLAMSLCLIAYRYARRRKIIRFALFVFLAYHFHHSAVLFVSVYLLERFKFKWYYFVAYLAVMALTVSNLGVVQEWFNDRLEYDYDIEATDSGWVFLALIALLMIFALAVLAMYRGLNDKTRPHIMIGFVCVFFWILRLETRIAERPSYYFMFFSCVGVAYALNQIKETKVKFILKCSVMGVCLLLFAYRMLTNFSGLTPYQTFWG